MAAAALDGLVVVDLSRVLAGPYCTMMLADLGATVIKVERPGAGDDTRQWRPPVDGRGESTYFASVNRGKHSYEVDFGDPAAVGMLREVIAHADVVIENFAAEGLSKYGLDSHTLRAENPALVYCSITGFGSHAGADLPGYDLLVQAMGGLMSITGPEPSQPTKAGVALVDVITGLHATVGILAALNHRTATGEGQHVEVNLLSSLLSSLVNQVSAFVGAGVTPRSMGNAHPSIAPYEVFATADRPLVVAVGNDAQYGRFADVLGDQALRDSRFATNESRVRHRAELRERIEQALAHRRADEWFADLREAGIPAGPINTIPEAVALAEHLGLNPVVDIDGQRYIANPISLSQTPPRYVSGSPRLGSGDSELLDALRKGKTP